MNNSISLNIGGEQRRLKFGMYSTEKATEFVAVFEKVDIYGYGSIMYGGLCNAAILDQTEEPTPEQVLDWIEAMAITDEGKKDIAKMLKCFKESNVGVYAASLSEKKKEMAPEKPKQRKTKQPGVPPTKRHQTK